MNINREYITKINFTDKNDTSKNKYIVIHYFGGLSTAKNLAQYWATKYAGASAHYAVGHEGDIFQIVEDDDIAWHCGASSYKHAECRNSNSIGIEMAVRKKNTATLSASDKDWYFEEATIDAAVELTRLLMQKYGITADHVIRHYDVTGKICPNPYVYECTEDTWEDFKRRIAEREVMPATNAQTPAGTNEDIIWQYLSGKGLNAYAVAGIMGNLYAESRLSAKNLQNSFEGKLDLNDDTYTAAVDAGTYGNFIHDGAGYGLAQWTFYTRKQSLLSFAKERGTSIGDLMMQLDFFWNEIQSYKHAFAVLKSAGSVLEASNAMLLEYEKPADQSAAIQSRRANYALAFFKDHAAAGANTKPTEAGVKQLAGRIKIVYAGADGVNYRTAPDYNMPAAGQAHAGEVFTVVGETDGFYKLKSGWFITKREDLVEFTQTQAKRYARIIYKGSDGVNYRNKPDYNAAAAGVVHYGEVFTIVGEEGDFWKLKSGVYLTKREDLVEVIEAV